MIYEMTDIEIVRNSIKKSELNRIASEEFGNIVKAAVDVSQKIMAVGGELHADEEVILAEQCSSKRENIWGINLYPQKYGADWIEFNSMTNIKPHHGNFSRGVDDSKTRDNIVKIVNELVTD